MVLKNITLYFSLILLGTILISCNRKKSHMDTPNRVLGIDVSHFQNDVNWEEIKHANISFVYVKASQGTGYKDPRFDKNWQQAKEAGLYRGAYHFYLSDEDPLGQAHNFIKIVEQLGLNDMPPVLDLEELGIKGSIDEKVYQENALTWLKTVEDSLKIKPIIYADPSFCDKYLNNPAFSGYSLWLAEYGVKKPHIPKAWGQKGESWVIWQRTDRGKVEGAIGNVDHDLFNGDIEVLQGVVVK